MTPNWALIDSRGPSDDMPVRRQDVTLEESETEDADAAVVDDTVQDVKP